MPRTHQLCSISPTVRILFITVGLILYFCAICGVATCYFIYVAVHRFFFQLQLQETMLRSLASARGDGTQTVGHWPKQIQLVPKDRQCSLEDVSRC
jgi:hypothetical protein